MAHVPGLENVVADALTRQYDDEERAAIIHTIVHKLTDVDLAEIAREQRPIAEEDPSSLKLQSLSFPGINSPVIYDTSMERPRILVSESRRRRVSTKSTTWLILSVGRRWPSSAGHMLGKTCDETCYNGLVSARPVPPARLRGTQSQQCTRSPFLRKDSATCMSMSWALSHPTREADTSSQSLTGPHGGQRRSPWRTPQRAPYCRRSWRVGWRVSGFRSP